MTDEFLNPYGFIPALPRTDLPEPLRDGRPPGHDRLATDDGQPRWTGQIGVTMTVETPVVVLDTTRATRPEQGDPEHRVYPVLTRNGRPHLPPTSIKGMLRAAYEAITNSRMGVFRGHDEPLGYRRPTSDGLKVEPVVVTGDRRVRVLKQAKLARYPESPEKDSILFKGTMPKHRQGVAALIKGDRVERLSLWQDKDRLAKEAQEGQKPVTGFAYITGRNIPGKKDERLFYRPPDADPEEIPLDQEEWDALVSGWEALIRNYRGAHSDDEIRGRVKDGGAIAEPWEWLGHEPGQPAWSPHLYEHLTDSPDVSYPYQSPLLCWARFKKVNGQRKIAALYPVMISRDLHPAAPAELLHPSLHPADSFDKLSPADRVFGWVAPEGSGRRPAAYRGRLRIGPVVCDQDAEQAVRTFDGDGLPLAILGRPRPEQVGFYAEVRRKRHKDEVGPLYQEGVSLRGRKAYVHHAGLPEDYWDEPQGAADPTQTPVEGRFREFRRPRTPATAETPGQEQRDSQNRSIKGWIKPGTVFRFTIDVRNLDQIELGALVWLLRLPQGHFHRLGLGKPLGFGSVRLDIDLERTELASGDQWRDYYRSLTAPLASAEESRLLDEARAAYEALLERTPPLRAVKAAFLAAAKGDSELPVHYPRTRPADLPEGTPVPPNPEGNNYAWFTENARAERLPLPRLGTSDAPLRILPEKDDKKEQKDKSRKGRKPRPRKRNG